MYQNYIFDLYGTLVDIHTEEDTPDLWEKMALYMTMQGANYKAVELRNAYLTYIDDYRKDRPNTSDLEVQLFDVIKRLYEEKKCSVTDEKIACWATMFRTLATRKLKLFTGAKELLERLHAAGKKVYLLSNAQRLFTEPEMRALGIYDLFDDIFYSSDIGYMKPSALFYQSLIDKHRLNLSESVMVGNDWQADAWGAHNNGLPSMYVHTEQSSKLTGPLPPDCKQLSCISEVYEFS